MSDRFPDGASSILARFAAHTRRDGDCLLWTTGPAERYAEFDGAAAHRVAYWIATGDDPGERHVLHSCDRPSCVEPQHLRAGTRQENMADRSARGRYRPPGSISPDEAAAMRLRYAEGATGADLARVFGCSASQALRLVDGRGSAWNRRLTDEQIVEVRRRYAAGDVTQRALAAEYGVGQPHISYIVNGVMR